MDSLVFGVVLMIECHMFMHGLFVLDLYQFEHFVSYFFFMHVIRYAFVDLTGQFGIFKELLVPFISPLFIRYNQSSLRIPFPHISDILFISPEHFEMTVIFIFQLTLSLQFACQDVPCRQSVPFVQCYELVHYLLGCQIFLSR